VAHSASIPSGTVTLLFTDVQGSTRLWEAEPELMAVALRRHDEILRSAIEAAGGYVFKTVGDAFCAAFGTAGAAVEAALAGQRSLSAQSWATSRPILVRMGLHTGVCEERDSDYFGPVVNRAARLEAAAHGGQVLISGATAELLAGSLPGATSLRDLGLHRLKDLGRPEQVFQLEASSLVPDFPPLASLDNPELPNNLPTLLSAFVGREQELAEVRSLMRTSRLVTLTGAGGSGKTRLALQAGAELIGKVADGVWLAELASLTDGGQIPGVLAAALGMQDVGGPTVGESVIEALSGQESLVLLDNCEHLIDAAAKFCDQVIRHCPNVRFLATSREPLGIDGERIYRVPSLTLPDASAESIDDLAGSDAVQLFAERARAHQADFVIDAITAPDAVTICRRLDGIPLALELAAARLSSMSVAQVAARLDQRFRLLTGGSRNAMPRQQTLQATVEWSFGLLTAAERQTMTRLSVFAGGFDLEAAEAICASEAIDALDALDLLGSLVDKSLLVADHSPATVRYRLLETIRQYSAQELLRAAGDAGVLQIRERHARYYLDLANAGRVPTTGPDQGKWLRRFDTEWENLRAAFSHYAEEGRADEILELAVSLRRFSLSRGHAEVIGYLRPVIDRVDATPSALLAEGMTVAGQLMSLLLRTNVAELAAARNYSERALAVAEAVGDKLAAAHALGNLADFSYIAGDMPAGRHFAKQGVAIARELGNIQLLGEHLMALSSTAPSAAERSDLLAEALTCTREAGDSLLMATELNTTFGLAMHAERMEEANAALEEALAVTESIGGELILYYMRANMSLLRLIQGRYAEAASLVRGCLLASRRLGPDVATGELIFAAACVEGWRGDDLRAARLHGAGDVDIELSLQNRTINWSDAEQELRSKNQAEVRSRLGDAAYEEAYRAGARLSRSQALDLALGRDARA
jgi:predicted ATPase/class 3 adenylate cyclase